MTIVPNTFQCFNVYIDRAMELLTDAELRCVLYATRHIMGWQDKITKRRGVISLSMFENGYTDNKGNYYGGTGLGRNTIIKTTASLVTFGFFEKVGQATTDGQEWRLAERDIDWQALEDRKAQKDKKNKSRTKKATAASPKTKPRGEGVTSDVTGNVRRDEGGTSDVTSGGTSDVTESKPYQSHYQSHLVVQRFFVPALLDAVTKQAPNGAKQTRPATEFNPIKDAIVDSFGWSWETMTKVEMGRVQRAAADLYDAGVTPDLVPKLHAYCKKNFDTYGPNALCGVVSEVRKLQNPKTTGGILDMSDIPEDHPDYHRIQTERLARLNGIAS